MKRKFAAFDIDGTISRNALFFQIVDGLISEGLLDRSYEEEIKKRLELYKKRSSKQAFKTYAQYSVDILLENLDKISVSDYRKVVDKIIPESSEYNYVYTTNLIKKLKSEGYFLIALSGSEMYSVQKFTEKLGFDIAFGEHYHEENGMLTGKIDKVVGKKDVFINKFVEEHSLTFKDSIAIGDSSGDIAMLSIVENAVAFNPEDTLFEEAKKNNWKIVVERKNVIFELEPKDGSYVLA
jgi:HAD superfamily hydrolase (TIGR01490 family)